MKHKATKSKTNIETTALERSVESTIVGFKAHSQPANFTLDPEASLNTETHKNSHKASKHSQWITLKT